MRHKRFAGNTLHILLNFTAEELRKYRVRLYRRQPDGETLACLHDVPAAEANALFDRLSREGFYFPDSIGTLEIAEFPPVKTITELKTGAHNVRRH